LAFRVSRTVVRRASPFPGRQNAAARNEHADREKSVRALSNRRPPSCALRVFVLGVAEGDWRRRHYEPDTVEARADGFIYRQAAARRTPLHRKILYNGAAFLLEFLRHHEQFWRCNHLAARRAEIGPEYAATNAGR